MRGSTVELQNSFHVAVPVAQAWGILTDVERVAPCLPGAQLDAVRGNDYDGSVRVKLGPISVRFRGTASFVELDEGGRRAVLSASGREVRGQGNASATVTVSLAEDADGGTRVSVLTDLTITGKVAQFGRGVLAEVSAKLIDTFAANLAETVVAPLAAADREQPVVLSGNGSALPSEPMDVLRGLAGPVAKRVLPVLALVVVGLLLRRAVRRAR